MKILFLLLWTCLRMWLTSTPSRMDMGECAAWFCLHVLIQSGCSLFPVLLSSFHRRRKLHFIQAVKRKNASMLYTMVATSLVHVWQNFEENVALLKKSVWVRSPLRGTFLNVVFRVMHTTLKKFLFRFEFQKQFQELFLFLSHTKVVFAIILFPQDIFFKRTLSMYSIRIVRLSFSQSCFDFGFVTTFYDYQELYIDNESYTTCEFHSHICLSIKLNIVSITRRFGTCLFAIRS